MGKDTRAWMIEVIRTVQFYEDGALERLSDEDTVRYIQENPYVQYYLGLHNFTRSHCLIRP